LQDSFAGLFCRVFVSGISQQLVNIPRGSELLSEATGNPSTKRALQKSPAKEPCKRALQKSPAKEPCKRALPKSPTKEPNSGG